jgi:hypothetical protein
MSNGIGFVVKSIVTITPSCLKKGAKIPQQAARSWLITAV